jgi:hypothetical protein
MVIIADLSSCSEFIDEGCCYSSNLTIAPAIEARSLFLFNEFFVLSDRKELLALLRATLTSPTSQELKKVIIKIDCIKKYLLDLDPI